MTPGPGGSGAGGSSPGPTSGGGGSSPGGPGPTSGGPGGSGAGGSGPGPTNGGPGTGGAGPNQTPTPPASPENPSSGIDWDGFLSQFEDPLNTARTLLEVTRPIPLAGTFTGMAADTIEMYQDLEALPPDSTFTTTAVVFRDATMILNNLLGSLASLDQWVQDAATGSVVFAEVDVVTAPIQEGLKDIKLVLDGIQLGLDIVIAASAQYNATHAATPEEFESWNGILRNYQANILSDTLTTIIDGIDAATVGAANGENVKQVVNGTRAVIPASKAVKDIIIGILQGWFGVYGGGLMPGAKPPPNLAGAGGSGGGGGAGGGGAGGGPVNAWRTCSASASTTTRPRRCRWRRARACRRSFEPRSAR
jgi:hypothetical protein